MHEGWNGGTSADDTFYSGTGESAHICHPHVQSAKPWFDAYCTGCMVALPVLCVFISWQAEAERTEFQAASKAQVDNLQQQLQEQAAELKAVQVSRTRGFAA